MYTSPENDVLIFHERSDDHFASQLNNCLARNGLKAIQSSTGPEQDHHSAGFILDKAVTCRNIAVILSGNVLQRPWVRETLPTLLKSTSPTDKKIIPVLLRTDYFPDFLFQYNYADFSESFACGLRDLVMAIKPERVRSLSLPLSHASVEKKLDWLANHFSEDWIRRSYHGASRRIDGTNSSQIFSEIQNDIARKFHHLKKSEAYSFEGISSSIKSVRNILREHLETQSLEPLHWLFCTPPDPQYAHGAYDDHVHFSRLLTSPDQHTGSRGLMLVLRRFQQMTHRNEAFIFANETIKHKTIDDFIEYCTQYLNFEIA